MILPLAFGLSACGSSEGSNGPGNTSDPKEETFAPPALEQGYTRLEAMTVAAVEPGKDLTRCQYAMAPFDRDMDVLDVLGGQSPIGHHLVAFSYVPQPGEVVGAEIPCMMGSTEFNSGTQANLSGGGYLGAASPVAGRVAALPEGVAYRLKQGEGIVLNMHYINTGDVPADGEAYLDLKFVDVDPNRLIASLFVNFNGTIDVAPNARAESSVDCVAQSDVEFIMMSNHMHEWGTQAATEVTRADTGAVEVMRADPAWTEDLVNAPSFQRWTVDAPFVLHAGDTIRTSCTWTNTTTETLGFPREMCVSAGFALAKGSSPKVPSCFDGTWIDQGL